MNRKRIIIIVVLALIAAVALAVFVYKKYARDIRPVREQEPQAQVMNPDDDHITNKAVYFEDETPHADSMMVGKWQNMENPQWYKVYYDDYAEDGMFWGKEWDESEDVLEEDLNYHGNGWFRWRRQAGQLREFATMDTRDVPIAKEYKISQITGDSLVYKEMRHNSRVFHFARTED